MGKIIKGIIGLRLDALSKVSIVIHNVIGCQLYSEMTMEEDSTWSKQVTNARPSVLTDRETLLPPIHIMPNASCHNPSAIDHSSSYLIPRQLSDNLNGLPGAAL